MLPLFQVLLKPVPVPGDACSAVQQQCTTGEERGQQQQQQQQQQEERHCQLQSVYVRVVVRAAGRPAAPCIGCSGRLRGAVHRTYTTRIASMQCSHEPPTIGSKRRSSTLSSRSSRQGGQGGTKLESRLSSRQQHKEQSVQQLLPPVLIRSTTDERPMTWSVSPSWSVTWTPCCRVCRCACPGRASRSTACWSGGTGAAATVQGRGRGSRNRVRVRGSRTALGTWMPRRCVLWSWVPRCCTLEQWPGRRRLQGLLLLGWQHSHTLLPPGGPPCLAETTAIMLS